MSEVDKALELTLLPSQLAEDTMQGSKLSENVWYWLNPPKQNIISGIYHIVLEDLANSQENPWMVTSLIAFSIVFDAGGDGKNNQYNVITKSVYNRNNCADKGFELQFARDTGARFRLQIKVTRDCKITKLIPIGFGQ